MGLCGHFRPVRKANSHRAERKSRPGKPANPTEVTKPPGSGVSTSSKHPSTPFPGVLLRSHILGSSTHEDGRTEAPRTTTVRTQRHGHPPPLKGRTCSQHCEQLPTGAFTTPARLCTHPAVLMVIGVPRTLGRTRGTDLSTGFHQGTQPLPLPLGTTGQHPTGHLAQVRAVQVQPHTFGKRRHVLLRQTGVRTRGAGLGARDTRIDTGGDLVPKVPTGVLRVCFQHPSGDVHDLFHLPFPPALAGPVSAPRSRLPDGASPPRHLPHLRFHLFRRG